MRVAATSWPLIGAIVLFVVATVHAQAAPDVALVVRGRQVGAVRCFEVDALRQRIAHYSATDLAGAGELRLELLVDAEDSAELRVYRGAELAALRRFDHLPAACADRRDAVALSIALALDGVIHELAPATSDDEPATSDDVEAAVAPPAPQPELAHPELARPELAPTPPKRVAAAKPVSTEGEVANGASATQDSGQDALPAPGSGSNGPIVVLHIGGRWLAEALPSPVWTGALGAELWLDRRFAIDGSVITSTTGSSIFAGARAQTRLTGGELLGCGVIRFGNFAAQGCLGAVAAACEAHGENYPVPFPKATVLWAASTARLALRWPDASRVSLRIVAQGHVNMVRPELHVRGSSAELAPSWLGGSAGLDMLVSLE